MSRRISDRLSEAARTSFVGREREVAVLRGAIEAAEPPFVVAFVHGPGGIGKSRLLQATLGAVGPQVHAFVMDCRVIEPTPKGFLAALGNALRMQEPEPDIGLVVSRLAGAAPRTVLALDTYETFGLMDTWLRQVFVPDLPESVLTIFAGREVPNPAWLTTPGWEGLFREIELRELGEAEARQMLQLRGVTEAQAGRVNRFARGLPLALELAAAALRTQPELDITGGPPPNVVQQLTQAFLTGLPPQIVEATEAAATVRRLTEPMLRALLEVSPVKDVFDTLQDLPFVDATAEGLTLHDVVRDTIASDLARRDPERYRTYRRRAWRFFTSESHRVAGGSLWQCTADMLYLIENPVVRDAFFPKGATDYRLEPATAADADAIGEIAASEDAEESAQLILRWWHTHPETFSVAKASDGSVVAFYILFEPADVDPKLLSDDPLTAAWSRHLRENPIADGERVLFLRRWLAGTTGELPSPAQAACWLDIKRIYMELRPSLRRLYTTVTFLDTYAPIVCPLGFAPLEEVSVTLGGTTYHTALLDFGEASVDGWLATLVGEELGVEAEEVELPEGTATILFADIADSTLLTEQLGDAPFRARARELDAALRAIISETGGRTVEGKLLGDGVMAVFSSAHRAIECAARCNAAAEDTDLRLHIGAHAGDVIREGDNVFGGAVNIAARIAAKSAPGEVLVSETVRSLARTSTDVKFEDRGYQELKGVAEAQRLFAVRATVQHH
jgi:class 3 adenylate cyclase